MTKYITTAKATAATMVHMAIGDAGARVVAEPATAWHGRQFFQISADSQGKTRQAAAPPRRTAGAMANCRRYGDSEAGLKRRSHDWPLEVDSDPLRGRRLCGDARILRLCDSAELAKCGYLAVTGRGTPKGE
jgi:hypothetical protein